MEAETLYLQPRTIEEALDALKSGSVIILAGGTDVLPAHAGRPLPARVMDISRLDCLRGITVNSQGYRFGALTTWSDIAAFPLPAAFDGLKAAAREVGSLQIQNRGTIAGNICNASPAADSIPPLLTLDASVEIQSPRGSHQLALKDFVTGYRKTALADGEFVSAIRVPPVPGTSRSAFVKLGARRYLVISILMASALVERGPGRELRNARVAAGAASPVAARLPDLERSLEGLPAGIRPSSIIAPSHLSPLSPISDVRATAAYRLDAASAIIGQALDLAAGFDRHD